MSIRNCPECGRIFEYVFKNLCQECIQQEEEDFKLIKDYLRGNRGVGISQISEATGVSARKIIRMLKSGMLVAVCEENDIRLLTCERCGKPIVNGNFCQECCDSMSEVLSKAIREKVNHADIKSKDKRDSTDKQMFTTHFNK